MEEEDNAHVSNESETICLRKLLKLLRTEKGFEKEVIMKIKKIGSIENVKCGRN